MKTSKAAKTEILKRLFATFKQQDREVAEQLLAEHFTFTSPYDDAIDRAAYFDRCWPNAGLLKEQSIERILVEGDAAYVTYLAGTHEGTTFRNTELFTFAGDKIASVEVFFGVVWHHGVFARMH